MILSFWKRGVKIANRMDKMYPKTINIFIINTTIHIILFYSFTIMVSIHYVSQFFSV